MKSVNFKIFLIYTNGYLKEIYILEIFKIFPNGIKIAV